MRLLPLREHKDKLERFLELWIAYLQEQELPERAADAEREIFLIEYNNEVIGFAEVHLEEKCFPDEDLPEMCLHILAFYVASAYRRHHHGHDAFKLVCQWGRDNTASMVEIEAKNNLVASNQFLQEQGLELISTPTNNIYRGFI